MGDVADGLQPLSHGAFAACVIGGIVLLGPYLIRYSRGGEAVGIDGYYYELQARSILETGTCFYRDKPCSVHIAISTLSRLTPDLRSAVNFSRAIAMATIVTSATILAFLHTRDLVISALVYGATATSEFLLILGDEFLAQGLSTAALMAGLVALCLRPASNAQRRLLTGGGAGLIATGASFHRSAIPIVVIFLIAVVIALALAKIAEWGRLLAALSVAGLIAQMAVIGIKVLCPDSVVASELEWFPFGIGANGLYNSASWIGAIAFCLTALSLQRPRPGTGVSRGLSVLLAGAVCNPFARYDLGLTGHFERVLCASFGAVGFLVFALALWEWLYSMGVTHGRWLVAVSLLIGWGATLGSLRTDSHSPERIARDRRSLRASLSAVSPVVHPCLVVAPHGAEFQVAFERRWRAASRRRPSECASTKIVWILRQPRQAIRISSRDLVSDRDWLVTDEAALLRWLKTVPRTDAGEMFALNSLELDGLWTPGAGG